MLDTLSVESRNWRCLWGSWVLEGFVKQGSYESLQPGRLTAWFTYSPHPSFRKENDLNQSSMRTCSQPFIFRGVNQKKAWKRYRIPIGFEIKSTKSIPENGFETGNYTSLKILVTAKAPENWMSKQDDPRTLWGLANISEALGSAFICFFFLKAQNLARSLNSLWQNVVNSKVRGLWMKIKMYFPPPKKIMMIYHCQPCWKFCRVHTRWPPIS